MVRRRIAGSDFESAHTRIFDAPGPRWFTPDDPIWRVHADASMFVGGIRALLLQSLHPRAMAAVSQHSGFRGDPWGRLQRTSAFLATTTYGSIPAAERMIAAINRIHAGIEGRTADGIPYRASDPELLAWVHVAEVDSFLATHDQFGASRLTDPERDRYVAQAAETARRLGVIDPPTTVAEMAATLQAYRPELRMTVGSARGDGSAPAAPSPVTVRADRLPIDDGRCDLDPARLVAGAAGAADAADRRPDDQPAGHPDHLGRTALGPHSGLSREHLAFDLLSDLGPGFMHATPACRK